MPLTPYLCFSLDVPSVLFHVTDLKLSNRDSRASLQRARNVASCAILLHVHCEREAESPRLRFRLCFVYDDRYRTSERCTKDGANTDDDLKQMEREEDIFSVIPLGNIQVPQELSF